MEGEDFLPRMVLMMLSGWSYLLADKSKNIEDILARNSFEKCQDNYLFK